MGNAMTGQDKAMLEKEWIAAEARLKLSPADKAKWAGLGCTIRPYVYYDKLLVAWHLVKGQPQVKDIFQAVSVDANFQGGLWVCLRSKVTNEEITLTHTPQRLSADLDIYGWMPFFNEVRYASADWNNLKLPRNMRLTACFKMVDNPDVRAREGQDYLSELHIFRERFPQYSDTRF